jgi:Fe-S-cluster-containing dehydrogenase component
MARYAMVIDTKKCVGCMDCVVACKTENNVPEGFNRDWLTYETAGIFPNLHQENRSERCNQCDNPPCVYCCPCGASHISDIGGIVLVHEDKCSGCKACMAACPYDARYIHPEGYASKCTFCSHRVEQGLKPACGDLEDPKSEVSRLLQTRKHHALIPEAGTEPHVFYLT